jgi:hydrogenase maturation protease
MCVVAQTRRAARWNYALTSGYRLAVLIDTAQRGTAPGTRHLIEPESQESDPDPADLSPHQTVPASVLRMAQQLGGARAQVLLVGCEPASFGELDHGCSGRIGLSDAVAAVIGAAAAMTVAAIGDWLREHPPAPDRPDSDQRAWRETA